MTQISVTFTPPASPPPPTVFARDILEEKYFLIKNGGEEYKNPRSHFRRRVQGGYIDFLDGLYYFHPLSAFGTVTGTPVEVEEISITIKDPRS